MTSTEHEEAVAMERLLSLEEPPWLEMFLELVAEPARPADEMDEVLAVRCASL